MAYDEAFAARIRIEMAGTRGLGEKRMFGGVAFLVNGNMACGVIGDELAVRVGPDAYEAALQEQHVREFDFTGRPMKGWVMIGRKGLAGKKLGAWVARGRDYATSLPAKKSGQIPGAKPARTP